MLTVHKYYLYILFLLLGIGSLQAQDERFGIIGKHAIEVHYQFGRIIPHNSRFKTPITGYTHGFELSYYYQALGKKAWQRKLHCPEVGGSFYFAYNADQKYFGNVYGLVGFAKFWIVRSKFVDFYVRAGTGLVLTPTHFNLVKNPDNVAIGSLVNSMDELRFGLDFKPTSQVQIGVGLTFTHYSNASIQKPNLGVNMPALTVGIRYFPKVSKDYSYNREKWNKPKKRHEVMFKLGVGVQEKDTYNGPKYPVYVATGAYAYYTSIVNKVSVGISSEFNQGAYDFYGYYGNDTKYRRSTSAMNLSIFVGDEIMMGKVGLCFAAGAYVFNPRKDPPVYAKLGLNYYFVAVGKNKTTKFFIGSTLKTHFLIAQFFEMSTGVVF